MPRILLTGANGKTGRAVLKALTARPAEDDFDIKVFIRNEDQWPELQALGAHSFAIGDMGDSASIEKAVQDCHKVIHIGPPMHPQEVEFTQGFIDAAKRNDVSHFIYYSVMHPLRRDVRHHRLKLDAEQALIESMLPYTIVQPIRYMQHLLPIWGKVKETGIHAMPFNTRVRFNVVDLEDLAEATAIIASGTDYLYGSFELAGPQALSQEDMAEIIAKKLGRSVTAEQIPLQQVAENARAKGFDEDRVEQMLIMNKHYDECGFLGNPKILSMILGREPRRYEDFIDRLASQD